MKNYLLLNSIFAFVFIFSGCNKSSDSPKNDNVTAQTIFLTSDSQNACENKIREQFEQNQIQFVDEMQFKKNIALANQLLHTSPIAESYSFDEQDGQIQEIKKTLGFDSHGEKAAISFTLGLNDKNSAKPMYFELKSEQRNLDEKSELTQRYSVNNNCDLNLIKTSFAYFVLNEKKSIHYELKTITDSETTEEMSKDFVIPDGKNSIDFLSMNAAKESISVLDAVSNAVSLIPGMGFADIEMQTLSPSTDGGFGKTFQFDRRQITISINKKTLIQVIMQIDFANEVQLTTYVGINKKSWTLPKAFRSQISLGQAQLGSSYFESKLSANYQQSNSDYLLIANKDFSYNLAGYYKTTLIEENEKSKTFKMQEIYPPVFNDRVKPIDLEANSTIQSDLPEIQKIAQSILLKSSQRKQQIAEILKYLSSNYTYDYDMVEKEKVRALTTKEALDRKKGVCQHYAVLFTAIARALKIPSRIVVGYHISAEKPGMHAWVEAEIQPNQWQVIEPQSAEGLTQTRTRFYFPLIRGYFLEDKNAINTEFITTMMNLKFVASPVL
ncbi:MAG: transglutaminase domain-containing protein [Bdellovibrio sp.]|nr:transglutaminase domain-containing protein [Bdellovibrio sp.]